MLVTPLSASAQTSRTRRLAVSNGLQPEAPNDALADFRRLQEISTRLIGQDDLETLLREILDAAIEITRADFGNIQLISLPGGVLKIVTQRGFGQEFLDFFNS